MKRENWLVICFVIGVAVILFFAIREYFFGDRPAPTAAPGLMALASPEPTQTMTPSPAPTIDYSITYPEATKAEYLDQQADSAERLAQAESTKAAAANTQIAATSTGLANAQMPGTPTAIAIITAQAQKTQDAIETAEGEARAAYFEGVSATKTATAEAEKMQNNIETGGYFTVMAIILVIVIFAARWFFRRLEMADWSEKIGAKLPENLEQESENSPAPVVPDNAPAYPGGLDLRLFLRFCTISQLRKIAAGLQAGESFTHDRWTPSQNGMSETQFTKLQNLLCDYRAAEWNDETHKGGVTLAEKGVKFFADVLKTTSPLNQDVPNNPLPAGFEPIDRPDRPGEWGRQEG